MERATRVYVATWAWLVLLAALSLVVSFTTLGPVGIGIALAIATIKAVLVAGVFMHLFEEPFIERLALGVAVGLLLLMLGLVVAEVLTR
jgi:cytochrome c oxidase subunit 4